MDILELINKRHSTRSYTGEFVDDERLIKILEAGRLSPSARNTQPWKLYASVKKDIFTRYFTFSWFSAVCAILWR